MPGYDIHFQPVPESDVVGTKVFTFGFRAALKVSGPQALVNRWVKTFMTPKGSDPLDKQYGTTFPNLIGSNISIVNDTVKDVILLAVEDANSQVRNQDLDGFYSDDERLMSATFLDYIPSTDGFQVWIEIKNLAGDVLPVRLMDLATR